MPTKEEINTFSINIENLVEEKDIPYMDAILMHCEESGLEVEVAAKLISSALKIKLQMEAEDLHFLPKSNTTKLPI